MFANPASSWWHFALGDIAMYGLFLILGAFLLADSAGTLVVTAVCTCTAFYQMRLNHQVKRALSVAGIDIDDGTSVLTRPV